MTVTVPERLADLVRAAPGRLVLPDRPRDAYVAVPTPLRLFPATSWYREPVSGERAVTADQTNESVIVGEAAVVKWAVRLPWCR